MGEIVDNSIKINSILLARNTPVALVVGAAGFLGSSLVDELLKKGLQVIGVDNFKTGQKKNLEEAVKNRRFHLLNSSAEDLDLELVRIDYLFIAAGSGWNLKPVLELAKSYQPKLVFVSSINLYEKEVTGSLKWYKTAESQFAEFCHDNKLNARVIRLAPLYGPRMDFQGSDPATKLIKAALLGNLQKESTVLDFSTRALYIEDAVTLIVKSILSGATSLKIFDGASSPPIKIEDVKQILLDPLWYENKGFIPTELPPWSTPNLEKTMKLLSWKPRANLVQALKKTLAYFNEQEIEITTDNTEEKEDIQEYVSLPKHPLDISSHKDEKTELQDLIKTETLRRRFTVSFKFKKLVIIGIIATIFYALVYPILLMGWGIYTFKSGLNLAAAHLSKGEFQESLKSVERSREGIDTINNVLAPITYFGKKGIFPSQAEWLSRQVELANLINSSATHAIQGTESLYSSLKSITGESTESVGEDLVDAQVKLTAADEEISQSLAILNSESYQNLPGSILEKIRSLKDSVVSYSDLVHKARTAAIVLREMVGIGGQKKYLVLLQNNSELRPTGGFIGSFVQVDFEGGKLKKLEINDIYAIDGQLKFHVEPPKEIKEDLGQKEWFLRDANWEPDFPTAARQAEWFYRQETGNQVDGVIALDISAIENLLRVIGNLDLADYEESISADNLFEKVVTHSEQGFFPGSQAKKNFLTALTSQLFNKIFFLPNQNWPEIVSSLGKSLHEKHLLVYFTNTKLASYMISQNWGGVMPRAGKEEQGELEDFLSLIEANLGANKANYYIERNYDLGTAIGKEGEIVHRLKISYTNRSPADVWPAGRYKNRMRIYVPQGTNLTKAIWGESDITSAVSAYIDYGRTVYSLLLELEPKENKQLVLEYSLARQLTFQGDSAKYRLDLIKQPGTLQDPFEWSLTYPINYRLTSKGNGVIAPQEHKVSTDLSVDRSFIVDFTK